MEKFTKKPEEGIISGVIETSETSDTEVINRLTDLAKQTNACTLFVYKLAERTARDSNDMELFLKFRKYYAQAESTKRSKSLRKRALGDQE